MSFWQTAKWATIGVALAAVIVMPIATWVWRPPELLNAAFGGIGAGLGLIFGAWREERKS